MRYDWDHEEFAEPPRQLAIDRAFWRGAVYGALMEAVLLLAAVAIIWVLR